MVFNLAQQEERLRQLLKLNTEISRSHDADDSSIWCAHQNILILRHDIDSLEDRCIVQDLLRCGIHQFAYEFAALSEGQSGSYRCPADKTFYVPLVRHHR